MAAAAGVGRDSLPEHWSYGVCRDGRVFFIDDQRRCTTWLHPRTGEPVNSGHMIRYFSDLFPDLPRGWEEGFSEEGASYFIDHNQQTTAFRHPVTGQFSPENIEFILHEGLNSHMSKQEFMNQRPSSMVSETSTIGTTSTLDMKSGPRVIKTSKIHSFGKRDQAIRRNPNVPVVVRGWLHKQDSSGMRLWKRRWFVLADYCLFYYKDSREEAVLGSIPLPSYVISPVGPEDRINRKYSFKLGSFLATLGHLSLPTLRPILCYHCRDAERTERQAVPQANHTDSCRECGRLGPGHARDCSQRAHNDAFGFDRPEQDEEERYGFQRDPLEGKRERGKSKPPYPAPEADSFFVDLPSGPRAQSAQPQLMERNGVLAGSFGGGAGLGEQNGTGGYKRVFPPPTNPEKHAQRRSNMAQVENWVKVQKGDDKSLVSDHIRSLQGNSQSFPVSFPDNYQTLPRNARLSSGSSPPPLRNLPSDYKYAQDRASHLKMSNEERRAHRDGTVWQLYEWQQRQQFKHGNPTAPIYAGSPEFADQGRSKSMLEVPRSISVPPSPTDLPPLGPPRLFPTRRPHTPAERVTVKPLEQRRSVDISLGGSPRKARGHTLKNSSHVDRRSMPSMGYMTHTVSAPSLHGKSADDTYLQLKKDLEYLDLKLLYYFIPYVIILYWQVKLSILCEQDRILQDLEDKIRALKENKDQLESVLEVLHRQMEQYKDQPQHAEKISYQQRLLQEDLVHIRAEISKLSTEMENAWNEYLKLENDVNQLKQSLQRQSRRSFFLPQERTQIQKDLWRIEDVTAGLSTNKANFKILVESFKNPERKTVPFFPHTPVPSVLKSLGTSESKRLPQSSPPSSPPWTSPAKTPLEVRLFPQLQTYVPYRTHPLQLRKVTSPAQSPTKLTPKAVEDEAPPRPPLPEQYSPEDPPPAVPPLPREATVIRHTSVRGLKRQSDERKRDRELGQCVNGDSKVELRSYMSEPELASLSGDLNQPSLGFVGPDSGYQTLPGRGFSGSTSRLQQASTIPSYVTLRRGFNADGSKVTFAGRPKSALERLYSGDHLRGKMSAEEQLERMKRHQKALVRERKRNLSQGEKQNMSSSHSFSRPSPGDLSSWKREQDFDLQLLERAMQGGEKDEDGWLKVQATPVTEMDLEPQDYDIDISRELSKPDKVSIPERYVDLEPEEPLSLEELEARFRKAEKIRNLLTRSSMHNLQPPTTQDKHRSADLDSQLQEQERIFHISHTLASEASQRSKQVAAQQSALLSKGLPSPSVPQPPLSNGFHYTFV
uniref:Pleckstrin homology domain containing A7 n=1 Tax=Monodelphis domestica TaxID=13616 RepID=F6RZ76_MONDO